MWSGRAPWHSCSGSVRLVSLSGHWAVPSSSSDRGPAQQSVQPPSAGLRTAWKLRPVHRLWPGGTASRFATRAPPVFRPCGLVVQGEWANGRSRSGCRRSSESRSPRHLEGEDELVSRSNGRSAWLLASHGLTDRPGCVPRGEAARPMVVGTVPPLTRRGRGRPLRQVGSRSCRHLQVPSSWAADPR